MKFRRELGSGGAGSDHHHVELPGPHRADLGMGAQHAVDQALVEPHRLLLRVEGDGVLLHPRRAEIVGGRAHREDQRIVGNRADGRDLTPLGIVARGELDRARATVESCHRADTIAEMMAVGVVEIVHRMVADIEAASGDLVQQRLPDMSAGLVHEGDVSLAFPAQRVAELGGQLKPRRASADDHDPMQVVHGFARYHAFLVFSVERQAVRPFCPLGYYRQNLFERQPSSCRPALRLKQAHPAGGGDALSRKPPATGNPLRSASRWDRELSRRRRCRCRPRGSRGTDRRG